MEVFTVFNTVMPRDLSALAKESNIETLPTSRKPTANDDAYEEPMSADDESQMIDELSERHNSKLDELHPYTQTLSMSDVESCVLLENAAFPPNERASREKVSSYCVEHLLLHALVHPILARRFSEPARHSMFPLFRRPIMLCNTDVPFSTFCILHLGQSHNILTSPLEQFQYRLKNCGELSLGIFTSQETSDAVTAETAAPVYSGAPERKAVLLGHILATKSTNTTVTDGDMAVPSDTPDAQGGHNHEGRTICIHSIAVLPEYQRRGLGSTLLKAYLQRMDSHGVADRVALIAHDHLIPYYEKFGFVNQGESKAQFGGGGWFDMVLEFEYDNH